MTRVPGVERARAGEQWRGSERCCSQSVLGAPVAGTHGPRLAPVAAAGETSHSFLPPSHHVLGSSPLPVQARSSLVKIGNASHSERHEAYYFRILHESEISTKQYPMCCATRCDQHFVSSAALRHRAVYLGVHVGVRKVVGKHNSSSGKGTDQ
ncbi:hypothetical protein RRG08_014791 [Elysia crispata]|uniref:Uncharacterized protein n=1 Tax=Elysia crispata TaxID=231223 RepID=A0AAE1AWU2_9GAST|nr:hypothetical protein RRG08_014791 [Elysia crispata]